MESIPCTFKKENVYPHAAILGLDNVENVVLDTKKKCFEVL